MITQVSEDIHYRTPPPGCVDSPSAPCWVGWTQLCDLAASLTPSLRLLPRHFPLVFHSDSDLHLTPHNIMLHVWFPSLISQLSSPPPHSSGRSKVAHFSVMCLQVICPQGPYSADALVVRWRRKWQPTPVLLPGEFHGQRSLMGCSPWGCKDSDMTEWLIHTHTYMCIF